MSRPRIEAVDILRGALACAVLLYHSVAWTNPSLPVWLNGLVSVLGTYSIDAFFVVSGFSLYFSYRDKPDVWSFARNRVLRLWPVYAVAVLAFWGLNPSTEPLRIAENLALAFGFYDAARALPVGGWAIAVAVVLSVLALPVIVFTAHRLRRATLLFVLAFFAMIAWTYAMPRTWATHVHPINHLAFFLAGMIFAEVRLRRWQIRPVPFHVVVFGGLLFAAGVSLIESALIGSQWGDVSHGPLRALLAIATIGFVGAFAMYKIERPSRAAVAVGLSSYPICLLHPVIWELLARSHVTGWWLPVAAAALTIGCALLVHRFFENPIIGWGKRAGRRSGVA
jgi:peptidoglycan/LPS O-acetylase OafA/YrhL